MAQPQTTVPFTFNVRRHAPELIIPAEPTPHDLKLLSDIDDQQGIRFQLPLILFYRQNPKMKNKNPASVIREALAKVLVFYYPFSGRVKEGPGRKLMVDCSGQGVLFIEAEADVTLEEFGEELYPPFPCMEELLYDVPGSSGILDSPLLLIQVTRLLCGGFILAIRVNHTMSDGAGFTQFMMALSEIANGLSQSSILPIWQRELLFARDPPRVTCTHHEYDELVDTNGALDDMEHRSFFFGPAQIAAIRRFVPTHLKKSSTFDVLTAYLWRCRTIALSPNPKDEMRIIYLVNARSKFNPPLPVGYYGNAIGFPTAISTAQDMCDKPLGHTLELVKKAKSTVSEEYMRSVIDLMVTKGRPHFTTTRTYIVTDLTRASGLSEIDFGWGKPVYAGPSKAGDGDIPYVSSFYVRFINHKGESGIVVPIWLPSIAMKRFVKELNTMLMQDKNDQVDRLEGKSLTYSKL
ncbi:hypothetical protein QVD17_32623 [Tagetes erecta]|uniref:Benzyl alcohol O-benzoyltransferase n=1 Tax=Tagetes erecta TaxID=13708 RepID=A0AAD8K2A7_TARER|nr:hypothetical protein QVD17_32623 [Tagetes erecta]